MIITCESCKTQFTNGEVEVTEPTLHKWQMSEPDYDAIRELGLGASDVLPTMLVEREQLRREWTCALCSYKNTVHCYTIEKALTKQLTTEE